MQLRLPLRTLFTVLAALYFTVPGLAQEPDPLPDDALNVLKLFTGKCDATLDGAPDLKGTVHGVLTLGGRFVRDDFVLKAADGTVVIEVSSMITYDTKKKLYRMWMFTSNGEINESEGPWNEATRTLTSTSRDAAKQETTTWISTFAPDGAETWKMVTTDKDGKVVSEVSGKSTARKHG